LINEYSIVFCNLCQYPCFVKIPLIGFFRREYFRCEELRLLKATIEKDEKLGVKADG
jgi:hypothetical protein